jgi:hypothetical protein
LRQAYRLPPTSGQSTTNGYTIPPMPVAWTPEVVRILFPIPLALGRKVTFVRALPEPVLVLMHAGERNFPSTAKGWVDLWTTIGQTTKPEAVKMALLQVRNAMRWAEATPFRDALAGLEAERRARLVLDGLVFLGGHDYGGKLWPDTVVDLRMTADSVVLTDVTDGSAAYSFPVSELRELEAIDPAAVMNDGLDPAAEGGAPGELRDQATAEWMTESSGKSSIMALVRIVTQTSELLLRSMTAAPDAAHIALHPLRRRLARERASAVTAPPDDGPDGSRTRAGDAPRPAGRQAPQPAGRQAPRPAGRRPSTARSPAAGAPAEVPAAGPAEADADDFVSHLERLARLRDSGALSEYEYLLAKTKLLS